MMLRPPPPPIFLTLVAAGCGFLIVVGVHSLSTARAHAESARQRLVLVTDDTAELARLRRRHALAQSGEPPSEDLLARVRSTLDRSGIPASSLQRLSRRGDAAVAGAGNSGAFPYRTRTEVLTLTQTRLPELGRFLDEWGRTQPLWTVTAIDLRESRGGTSGREASAGSYTVQMTLSTTYVQTGQGATP